MYVPIGFGDIWGSIAGNLFCFEDTQLTLTGHAISLHEQKHEKSQPDQQVVK